MKTYYQMRAYFNDEKEGKYSYLVEPFTVEYKTKKGCKKATEELLKNNKILQENYSKAYKMCIIKTTVEIVETYTK